MKQKKTDMMYVKKYIKSKIESITVDELKNVYKIEDMILAKYNKVKDIYTDMTGQNILNYYGQKLDLEIDFSEIYDFTLDSSVSVDLVLDFSETYDVQIDYSYDKNDYPVIF